MVKNPEPLNCLHACFRTGKAYFGSPVTASIATKEHSRHLCRAHLGSVEAVPRAVSSVAVVAMELGLRAGMLILHLQSKHVTCPVLTNLQGL